MTMPTSGNIPQPTKEPGQRSLKFDDSFLLRYSTPWSRPSSLNAAQWRSWVLGQPIAMICRETLIANFLSLDWKITPRESDQRDELSATVKHYTKLLENGGFNPNNFGMDYSSFVEWVMADLLDLPFGTGVEIGRRGDAENGRVLWLKPLDGGTLFPTMNKNFPVVQYYNGTLVPFPAHAIARSYISPRAEIIREGWGMAPPEKIILALEMLMRGDRYFANLLLDIPPAGILDLGDMEKDSAMSWIESFKSFMSAGTVDAFKIPVLYEHTTDVNFIPLGKVPNDIMYDKITLKYAGIVASGYGMSLSDIGLPATGFGGGETLAGTIRQERRAKKTGFARVKKKMKYLIESFLPPTLQFDIIDLDDEINVAVGRARLANSTAWGMMLDKGVFTREEVRLQTIQDGLVTITIPEKIPPEADEQLIQNQPFGGGGTPRRPGTLGRPVAPSGGGFGEVRISSLSIEKSKTFDSHIRRLIKDITKLFAPRLIEASVGLEEDDIFQLRAYVDESLFGEEDLFQVGQILQSAWNKKSWLKMSFDGLSKELRDLSEEYIRYDVEKSLADKYEDGLVESPDVSEEEWAKILEKIHGVSFRSKARELSEAIRTELKSFIGKSIIYLLKDSILAEDVVDSDIKDGYDNIVSQVYKHMVSKFDDFVSGCVDIETRKILDQIKLEVLSNAKDS